MKFTMAYDPVTRIEGHLKIEADLDKVNGSLAVVNVKSSGGLFRGFEKLLIGRASRDAQHITERICGVCPIAHGVASVMAQDNAFSTTIPANARIMRNLINGANFVESHILHFFLLAVPDFIEGPAMPPWQTDWKIDRRFTAAETSTLMSHYLQALTMRRKADQMTALFGGKVPHPPSFIPGGLTCTPRQQRINDFNTFLDELTIFIRDVYIPDVKLLAARYPDYFTIGKGYGNLLAYGAFDLNAAGTSKLLASGHAIQGSRAIETFDQANITEHVAHSWYQNGTAVNPSSGATVSQYPKNNAYSWLKAPRYENRPCEVGPLARMWVNGDYQNGISVMDRHLARAYECLKIAQAMKTWLTQIVVTGPVYVAPVAKTSVTGIGLTEAPRGALGHWLQVGADERIAHYQIISPTTWNASPRDNAGLPGPLEQALLGTPVINPDEPIEIMRIIHSFDPCLDCSTHVIVPSKETKVYRMGCI